ncbi:uncharacterized protein SPSK_06927 [Sporothrix schenckii 1099-18]|uniref:Uncharacterized protein n=1 Tax=Sporothrix schenckii 1099-18 TaxID=1397361 RepID=A0A0F2MK71_SPOSC|nr:uncharacterized protein SPSK_06927 [Sporothrix schenckii 1099-18]KJR88586.1 hypothetical protein SPSK_06927 [Sporothrix schenckii 1099-18]
MAGYSYSIQGGPAPAFPPREFVQQQQHQQQEHEQLQYQQYQQFQREYLQQQQQHLQQQQQLNTAPSQHSQLPPARNPKRGATRPASSIYSQPSPINTTFQVQQQQPPLQAQQYQHHGYSQSAGGQQYQQQQYQHHQHPQHHQQQPSYQYQDPRSQYLYYSQPKDLRNADGVSPESSPELSATELAPHNPPPTAPDISPVERSEPHFDMAATQATQQREPAHDGRPPSASRSNIPMMRRERRQTADAAAKTLRETKSRERLQQMHQTQQERSNSIASSKRGYKGGEVRWDPQTGELTSSQKGRPSQVKPAEYARGLAVDSTSPTEATFKEGKSASGASGIASFASRLRRTVQTGTGTTNPSSSSASAAQPPQPPLPPKDPVSPRSPAVESQPKEFSSSTDPAAGAFTSNRPAWHGASGRTALVAPVQDTPEAKPLNIPRKSSKRVASLPKLADSTTAANPSIISSPPRQNIASTTTKTPLSPATPGTQSYPSPPMSVDPTYQESPSSHQLKSETLPQSTRPVSSKIKRKPTPSHQSLASYDESDPFNYNNRAHPNIGSSPVSPPPPPQDSEWTQPPSRFSATTYNSTVHESLAEFDDADAPEMPSVPNPLRSSPPFQSTKRRPVAQVESNPVQQASPPRQKPVPILTKPLPGPGDDGNVMDRRRPPRMGHTSPNSIRNGNEPIVISLKTPWMSGNHSPLRDTEGGGDYIGNSNGSEEDALPDESIYNQLRNKHLMGASKGVDSSDRMSMAGSIHKNLPLAPPEMTAKDRVTMFNAQLASLAQRRINIGRSIKQMTELMPTDNLLATPDVLHKREMEKRKVEGLRTDLAEIQREEYEIGLKLHRAYKRLDKNAEYEPTTLWVRRVTG